MSNILFHLAVQALFSTINTGTPHVESATLSFLCRIYSFVLPSMDSPVQSTQVHLMAKAGWDEMLARHCEFAHCTKHVKGSQASKIPKSMYVSL